MTVMRGFASCECDAALLSKPWLRTELIAAKLLGSTMSPHGTFETCRLTLRMSVKRGRPEVISARTTR